MRGSPSFAGWFADIDEPSLLEVESIPFFFETYWVIFQALSDPGIWLVTFAVILVSLMPHFITQVLKFHWPTMKNRKHFNLGRRIYSIEPFNETDGSYVNNAFDS